MKLIGQPFGVRSSAHKVRYGVFACGCGQNVALKLNNGRRNKTCGGCQVSQQYGEADPKTYRAWTSMKRRCQNPNSKGFSNYGGRGIVFCDRWNRYDNFLADMGVAPEGCTLDRIDSEGDYCFENCRWATWTTQQNNRRNNKRIEINGKNLTLAEWSKRLGGHPAVVSNRLRRGWSECDAVTRPLRSSNSKCSKTGG